MTGGTLVDAAAGHPVWDADVITPGRQPLQEDAGIAVLRGNLAPRGAIVKPAAASPELLVHRGTGRGVRLHGGPARADRRSRSSPSRPDSVLVLRGCGPKGYPGMPEVANLPLPRKMLELGVRDMVRVCDGRMSGTAYGTVVLHVAPEAAAGGLLALVQDGDPIVLDVPRRLLQLDVPEEELVRRTAGADRHRGVRRPGPRLGDACTSTTCSRPTPAPTSTSWSARADLASPGSPIERPWRIRHWSGSRSTARPAGRSARGTGTRRCGSAWTICCGLSLDEARAVVESAGAAADLGGTLLAPVDSQEVWGAGVTYERSRDGRIEESTEGGVYDRIYVARRPEVFFKATAQRVVGDGRARRRPRRLALERPGARARPGAQRRRGDLRVRGRRTT